MPASEPRPADLQTPKGFSRLPTETLHLSTELINAGQIADLLAMTPHLYRASAEGARRPLRWRPCRSARMFG
ncbi:MAG: hypothetical protein ACYCWB_04260 [Thiobacillus sp.]